MRNTLLMASVAAVLAIGFTSSVSAEQFTFAGTQLGEAKISGVMTPDGMVGLAKLETKGTTTYASGTAEGWISRCVNFTSPQLGYDSSGYCINTTDGTGDLLNVVQVCNNVGDTPGTSDCWGYFAGGSGKYEKANGTVTWRATPEGAVGGGNLNTE